MGWHVILSQTRQISSLLISTTILDHLTSHSVRTCRAGRRCELCEGWKGGLQPYNARSVDNDGEAQLKDYMLVCGSCKKVIDVQAQGYKPRQLNFSEGKIDQQSTRC